MSQRVIACQVVGEYVTGDGVVIGSAGSHDEVIIELDFSRAGETWEGTTKTVTFTDALGLNPTNILLTANMLVNGTNDVYLVPIPDIIKAVSGRMGMTVSGVIIEGQTEVIRAATELSRFRVLPNELVTWEGDDVPASVAEQLQAEIDEFLDDIARLDDSVAAAAESEANAAASATAAADSAAQASTSETNAGASATAAAGSATQAGTSATNAAGSATTAAGKATLAESWAVGGTGTRTGENTNNAKYWSDQAQAAAVGVSSFNGRSGAVTPQSGDYTAAQVGALPADTPIPSKTSDLTNDSGFITMEQVPAVPVQSVNSKTGNVVLGYSDVGADQSGAAAAVQANLNTHDGNTTRHITADERTAWNGKQNALTFDNAPVENSANPVYSDGIKRYVDRMVGDVLFIATYGTTTSAEIDAAYCAGSEVVVDKDNYRYELKYRSNSTLHIFSTQTGAVRREITCNNNVWSEQVFTLANVNSPSLTGTPTAPTASAGTSTTQIATTAFVNAAVTAAIGTAIGGAY